MGEWILDEERHIALNRVLGCSRQYKSSSDEIDAIYLILDNLHLDNPDVSSPDFGKGKFEEANRILTEATDYIGKWPISYFLSMLTITLGWREVFEKRKALYDRLLQHLEEKEGPEGSQVFLEGLI